MKKRKNRRKQHTKPQTTESHTAFKASYLERFKAQIIDSFMIYTPILYLTTYLVLKGKEEFQNSDIAPFLAVLVYGIISALFVCLSTQTPGNRAQGIAIVSRIGQKIGFVRAFVRFVLFVVGAIVLWGVFVPHLWREKTTLHDWLCGTIVIKKP